MHDRIISRTLIGFAAILLLILAQGCAGINFNPVTSIVANREYSEGLRLFKAGEYPQAHQHALKAWSADPGSDKYRSLLGWTYLKQGNTVEAERLFSAIYKQHHDNLAALQGLAWVAYTKGRYPEARRWFEKQLKRAVQLRHHYDWAYFRTRDKNFVISNISDANYGLGLTALAQGQFKSAEEHFRQALKHRNDFVGHATIRAALGDAYYYRGDYSRAIGYYDESLREKDDPMVAAKVAWCFYYKGQILKANELFQKGLATEADQRPFLYGLVFTSKALRRTSESKKYLERLIRLDPYFADVGYVRQLIERNRGWRIIYKDLASAYFERGDFARAHEMLVRYLPTARHDSHARVMEAWCEVYLNLKTALRDFNQLSRERGTVGTDALLGKGVTLLYLGRLNESRAVLKEVVAKDPRNVRARVALGAVAFLKRDYRGAIAIYTANLSQLPKQELYFSWPSHALDNLGWSYIYTGDYQEALDAFKRLQAYHPVPYYPEVSDGLGWAYLHLGENGEAEKQFRISLSLWPGDPTAMAGLSRLSAMQVHN